MLNCLTTYSYTHLLDSICANALELIGCNLRHAGGKKRGKEELELEHLPSEYTLLTAFHALTVDFLDGQKAVAEAVYSQGTCLA